MPTCTRQHAQCQDSTMTPTRYIAEILAYLSLRGAYPLLSYLLLKGHPVRCSSTYAVESREQSS
jgi:hypothetical protein